MARNRIVIDASPEAVYDVLMDANAYGHWVVGAHEIRRADRRWPRVGSRFHHRVGTRAVNIDDSSKLLEKQRNRRIVLEARFRPLGVAHVALDLEPKARGRRTKVTMNEEVVSGPGRRLWKPLVDASVKARNAIALRRLRDLVASRTSQP
jgi:uncharacterized protein YndB with AHSA1/START domain